jgi:isopenicillin-N epimerase
MATIQSRREFFRHSALLLGAAAGGTGALPAAAGPSLDGDYWQLVRSQFSFSEDVVPMNAANLCPSFRRVAEQVAMQTADIDRDCSFNNRARFAGMLESARARVAAQLKVKADEVALIRNTSEGNNIINSGLDLRPGDEILLWDQNHPTNNVAWKVRAARFGLEVKAVSTPEEPGSAQELADTFARAMGPRTRVLAVSHVSNVSGVRLPIKTIVEAAKARQIYVHLDGAQTWGAMDLDLRDLDVDSYSASAHKWYMGPKEVGLLYIKEANFERIWPSVVAPGWGDDAQTDLIGARKFESLGQRDDAALAGLGVTAEIHDMIGPARIESRVVELTQRLKEGIADSGLQLLTPMARELSFGVCITRAPPARRGAILQRLYQEYGIAGAPTGGLRLSPHIYNTEAHIDRAIEAVSRLMAPQAPG